MNAVCFCISFFVLFCGRYSVRSGSRHIFLFGKRYGRWIPTAHLCTSGAETPKVSALFLPLPISFAFLIAKRREANGAAVAGVTARRRPKTQNHGIPESVPFPSARHGRRTERVRPLPSAPRERPGRMLSWFFLLYIRRNYDRIRMV